MSKQNCARLPLICQILIATPLSSLWVLQIPATIASVVGQKLAPDSAKILVVDQSSSLITKHLVSVAQAQMTPAVNSTTVVTPTSPGNNQTQFNITGGNISGDRANLFHSFQQFNLTENQIANFVTESNIKNIFTRINGGDPSLINGLIQITGSQANLFLMNPAGMIFGPNARLNLPAAFTVTTASGIELNNQWFSVHGHNQYELLTGSPSAFVFPKMEAGVIINAGDLSVTEGQNISLLGGTVVNTGNITAPYGQVTIAGVPGENVVRISQTGKLLNLELIAGNGDFNQNLVNTDGTESSSEIETPNNINPLSLPALLTGQSEVLQLATGLAVDAKGQVVLTGTNQKIPDGSGTAIIAGNIDVRTNTFFPYISGVVNILGDKIGVFGSTIQLSGIADAGLVRIGSDLPNNRRLYEASRTYVDDRTTISINGEGGRVIIGSQDITSFAGRVEIEGGQTSSVDSSDNLSLTNRLIVATNFDDLQNNNLVHVFSNNNLIYDGSVHTKVSSQTAPSNLSNLLLEQNNLEITDNNPYKQQNILLGDLPDVSLVSRQSLENNTGTTNIFLRSRGDININDLSAQQLNLPNQQGIVQLQADSDGNGQGSLIMPTNYTLTTEGGAIALAGVDIQAGNIISRGGEVYFSASNSLDVQNINSGVGNISLMAPQVVNVRQIITRVSDQEQGKITISSDEINLLGGEQSITGQGAIILETYQPAQVIEIGGTEDNSALNLTDADLASFADGFSSLTIGRADGSGNINLLNSQSFGFTDLVTVQSPMSGGTIQAANLTGQGNTSLTFIADSNITLANISGYNTVKIDSTRGAIALTDISTAKGAIDLHSYGKITGGNLTASLGITLTAEQGSIDLKNLTTTAVNNISGNVNITTNNGSARIGNINTSGNLGGGQVQINTVGYLTTGQINSSSQQGNGGSVTLQTSNNIEVNTINTQGALTGSGGDLQITTGANLRVTGTFTADNQVTASIATNGGEKGGAIAIEYRGAENSFTIGDSSLNGTAGAITDGQSTIQPTRTVPSNFNLQREADNIQSTAEPETRQDNSAISEENTTTTEQTTEQTTDNSTVSRIDQNLTREIVPVDNSEEPANSNSVNNQSTPPVDQDRIVTPVTVVQPINNQDSKKTAIAKPALPASNSTDNIPNTTANNTTDNSTRQVQDIVDGSNTAMNTTVANSTQSINAQSQIDLANTIETNSSGENISTAITSPLVNNQVNSSNITNNSSINPVVNNQINLTEDTGNLSLTSNQNSNDLINNTTVDNTQPIVNVDSYLPGQSVLNNKTNSSSAIVASANTLEVVNNIVNTEQVNPVNTTVVNNNPSIVQSSQSVDVIGYQNIPAPEINSKQPSNYNLIQIDQVDQRRGREFSNYFGRDIVAKQVNASGIRKTLSSVTHLGINSVILYVSAQDRYLELKLFLPNGKSVVKSIEVGRDTVLEVVKEFTNQVRKPTSLDSHDYLNNGKKLYDWLISPLEKELQQNNINTIIFSMDTGLRGLPLAALYDGQNFLVEKYAYSLVPSFSLTDTKYVGLKNAQVLAMGASEFPRDTAQSPLPSVPIELSNIITKIWSGQSFLNQDFTLANLQAQQAKGGFQIIHLATHGEFHPGGAKNSYIQFWDQKLRIDQLRQLNLSDPQVELLVLSACTTAIGDEDAELGFAGLAVQAGVKSALASLWYVSDTGTLALMTEFYRQLKIKPMKAEALRQAQLALLYKQVRLEEGTLRSDTGRSTINLPVAYLGDRPLSHPYYWAAFTMIGSPW